MYTYVYTCTYVYINAYTYVYRYVYTYSVCFYIVFVYIIMCIYIYMYVIYILILFCVMYIYICMKKTYKHIKTQYIYIYILYMKAHHMNQVCPSEEPGVSSPIAGSVHSFSAQTREVLPLTQSSSFTPHPPELRPMTAEKTRYAQKWHRHSRPRVDLCRCGGSTPISNSKTRQ